MDTVESQALQALLDNALAGTAVPGAALAVSDDTGEAVVTAGIANTETDEPVTGDTWFPIWSITKSMVAVQLLQLADEGCLSLDDRVVQHLPALVRTGPDVDRITVRDLLAHTSGLPHHDLPEGVRDEDDAVSRYAAAVEPFFVAPPGQRFSYSNVGYVLAAAVVEQLDGLPWESSLARRVWDRVDPVGFHVRSQTTSDGPGVAAGHDVDGSGRPTRSAVWRPRVLGPAGHTVHATAEALSRYARWHLDVPELARLRDHQVAVPDHAHAGWALGWMRYDWGQPAFGWDGVGPGFRLFLRCLPQRRTSIVLLTNGNAGRDLYRTLMKQMLPRFGASYRPDLPPELPPAVPARTLCEGTFQQSRDEQDLLVVTAAGGTVRATWGEEDLGPLVPVGHGTFVRPGADYPIVHVEPEGAYVGAWWFRRGSA